MKCAAMSAGENEAGEALPRNPQSHQGEIGEAAVFVKFIVDFSETYWIEGTSQSSRKSQLSMDGLGPLLVPQEAPLIC